MKITGILFGLFVLLQSCQINTEKSYYSSGQLAYEIPLDSGRYHGEMISYYENGVVKGKCYFEKGDLQGEAIGYDSLGNVYSSYNYINNKKNGSFRIYYTSGAVNVEGAYKDNMPDGKGFEYYLDGKLLRKYVYDMGDLIYMKAYSNNGVQFDSKLSIKIDKIDSLKQVKFELGYTEFDSAGIIIVLGELNSEKRLIDTLKILGARDLDFVYKYEPTETKLTGVLYEMKLPEKTIEGAFFFEYDIPKDH